LVAGNYIGTDITGTVAFSNGTYPSVAVGGSDNTIGGTTPTARNVIIGTGEGAEGAGVYLGFGGSGGATGNLVEGNYIGIDATGNGYLGAQQGAGIHVGCAGNTIGGTVAGAGNLIGNFIAGISIDANSNLVQGNTIGSGANGAPMPNGIAAMNIAGSGNTIGGTAPGAGNILSNTFTTNPAVPFGVGLWIYGSDNVASGNQIQGNAFGGVRIDEGGSNNTIGGTDAGAGNTISGNHGPGIDLTDSGTTGNVIAGNGIKFNDRNYTRGLPGYGVLIEKGATNNTLGGAASGAGNTISGNLDSGVVVQDPGTTGNAILGNAILGNGGTGVTVSGPNNAVGGTAAGSGNVISANAGDGVSVAAATGVSILGNAISASGGLGIHLDSATGANDNQAAPVLTAVATPPGATVITGTLVSVAGTAFRIEFFANLGLDASGNAEGQTYLGSRTATTDTAGHAAFTAANLAALPAGAAYLTATATNLSTGDTSPFGNYEVPTTTLLASSANPSLLNQPVTLTATVTSLAGTPTGSVDFVDTTTATDLGTISLSGGSAVLTTSALPLGTQTITASYSGSSIFSGSTVSTTVTVAPLRSIYVLNPTVGGALTVSGNAGITVPGVVVVDSTSATALSASGSAAVTASAIQVVGGAQAGGSVTFSPKPATGAAAVADPLAALAAPGSAAAQGSVNVAGNATLTINPGVYSQIKVSGRAHLTLNPGVYVLAGGGLTVTGNASISGSGVLLYNAGSNFPNAGGTFGGVTLSGTGTFNLTAADTGPYAGVVLFQARDNSRAIALGGNAVTGIGGTLYAPQALLTVGGSAQVGGSLVVNRLQLTGNGSSTLVSDGGGGTDASVGELVAGDLAMYVDNSGGSLTSDELARIDDAVASYNALLAPYSVAITEVSSADQANVVLSASTSSPCGGLADGVLGCYTPGTGAITLIQGWNYYAGADPSAIGAGQYDFEALAFHELGHALGLGGSPDPSSVMSETLPPGVIRRTPTTADLNVGDADGQPDAERAALPRAERAGPLSEPLPTTPAAAPAAVWGAQSQLGSLLAGGRVPAGAVVNVPVLVGEAVAVPTHAGGSVRPAGPPALPAAVVARGAQSPSAGAGNSGGEANVRADTPATDPRPRAADSDAFFQALPQGRGERTPSPAGGGAGVVATLRDLVQALGFGGGRDGGAAPRPAVENLTAGGPVLFALLGAAWAAWDEEPEFRRTRRPRRG
jgi:hypothetical protein